MKISDNLFSLLVLIATAVIFFKRQVVAKKILRIFDFVKERSQKEEFLIFALLIFSSYLLISQIWGTGITPGDDSYIAVDKFRRDGIWNSSMGQSVGQGRFYYLLTLTMSQVSYLIDDFAWANTLKIFTNVLIFYFFYSLIKELFGKNMAIFTGFIGLAFFDTFGEAVNPFFAWPLMYGLGAAFQLMSFYFYSKSCNKQSSFWPAYLLYFVSLLFYEPMIFYSLAYFCIYYFYSEDTITKSNWKAWAKKIALKNYALFLVVGVYLLIYVAFRVSYPSEYEGSKSLTFGNPVKMLKTIVLFSLSGVHWDIGRMNLADFYRTAAATVAILLGLKLSLPKIEEQSYMKQKRSFKRILLVVGFFIFSPNFLYGFVDKYRTWVDSSPYYVSSFYSAISVIIFVSLLISYFYRKSKSQKRFMTIFLFVSFVLIFSNISNASRYHLQARVRAMRWPLIKEGLREIQEKTFLFEKICSKTFFFSPEDTYDYWGLYLTDKIGRKITFTNIKKEENQAAACDIYVEFNDQPRKRKATVEISSADAKVIIRKDVTY